MKSSYSSSKVSVIIPNYNYARYVGDAIRSVLAQTYTNFEIIVVNNGSTDDSLDILRGFGDHIVLVDQANLGQSGARNSGLAKSTGELFAFLDADDVWEPTKLEKQISLIRDDTQLIYSGLTKFENESEKILSVNYPSFRGKCILDFVQNPGVGIVLGGESTVLFTRELFSQVGEFDTRLSISAGWDFFRRCSLYTKFDFSPEILVRYRIHGKNLSLLPTNNVSESRRAFYKLVYDKYYAFHFRQLLLGFLKLEWSFFKTLVSHRPLMAIREQLWFLWRFTKFVMFYLRTG